MGLIKSIYDNGINPRPGAQRSLSPQEILAINNTRSAIHWETNYYNTISEYFHLFLEYYQTNPALFGQLLSRTNLIPNMAGDWQLFTEGLIPTWELLLRCRWQGMEILGISLINHLYRLCSEQIWLQEICHLSSFPLSILLITQHNNTYSIHQKNCW